MSEMMGTNVRRQRPKAQVINPFHCPFTFSLRRKRENLNGGDLRRAPLRFLESDLNSLDNFNFQEMRAGLSDICGRRLISS